MIHAFFSQKKPAAAYVPKVTRVGGLELGSSLTAVHKHKDQLRGKLKT